MRDRHIKKPVIVVEYFGVLFPSCCLVCLKLLFDIGTCLTSPGVLSKDPFVFLFEFCVLFGKLLDQLGARYIFHTVGQEEVAGFVEEIQTKSISRISKNDLHVLIFELCHHSTELFLVPLMFTIPTQCQSTADFVNTAFGLDSADRQNKRGLFLTKTVDDVVVNQITLGGRHVDINITNLFTIFVAEATEHCMPCLRIEVCCVGDISYTRSTTGATIEADRDTMRFTPCHQFTHKKHEAGHLNFVKDPAFLSNGRFERLDLLWSDSTLFDLCLQVIIKNLMKHLSIAFTIENGILERDIQLKRLYRVGHTVGVLNGPQIHRFR